MWIFAGNPLINKICKIHHRTLPSKHLLFSRTSSRRLQRNNSLSSNTSSRRVCKACSKEIFKKSSRRLRKLSSLKRLQDVFARRLQEDALQLCLEDVLEDKIMSHWRRLQDTLARLDQDKCLLGSDGLQWIQWNLPIADMPSIADKMFSPKCDNLC